MLATRWFYQGSAFYKPIRSEQWTDVHKGRSGVHTFFPERPKCSICLDSNRNQQKICIVSEPKDVLAIEQSKTYTGIYHVLGGLISPLDGVYPEMLRFKELRQKIDQFNEVILALSPTVEGDTTGLYIQDLLSEVDIPIYKLAQGIPIGADLAYLDEVTIDKAFQGKIEI